VLDASREVDLEISIEKMKYMVKSFHKNVGQNHSLLIVNKFFENVADFKCLGTTVTNKTYIHEEIESRSESVFSFLL